MAKMLISLAITVGGAILSAALAPKPKDQFGPRLSDINVGTVSPGNPIIRHWGTMKLPGQLIWTSKIIETEHDETIEGGKFQDDAHIYTYTYSVDCAVAVCKGPVQRINRIWANNKLIWQHYILRQEAQLTFDQAYYAELDRLVNQENVTWLAEAYAGAFFFAFNNYRPDEYTYGTRAEATAYIMSHPGTVPHVTANIPLPSHAEVENIVNQMLDNLKEDMMYSKLKMRFDQLNLYLGSEEQLPNSKMEEYLGVGNAPSFRGTCYFVMRNLQLEDFGNGIPTFAVEVVKKEGTTFLHEIVEDICRESGMEDGEFDGLGYMRDTVEVPGYAITQSASGRQILNTLQSVFPFDAAETDYRLVFNWINSRPKAIIRRQDFGAHESNSEVPPSVEITRAQDFDLPRRLRLKFQEPARSYSGNTVFATRQVTDSETIDDIDATIALTRGMAKTRVEEMLALKFTARKSHKVVLPRKYVLIEPGDPVLVSDPADPYGNQFLSWRCVSADIGVNGLIEFVFVDHDQHVESGAVTEDDLDIEDNRPPQLPVASKTNAYLLDIPLLSDTEADDIGFYAMLGGSRNTWTGGALMLDISAGGTIQTFGISQPNLTTGARWYAVTRNTANFAHGFAMSSLPNALPGIWDYESKLRVYLMNKELDLSSANQSDMLGQPLNVALVGNEIVQFANAQDMGNGIWELSTFLRGLRGTDHLTGGHTAGERFVRLKQAAIKRISHAQTQLNRVATYRAISNGDTTDEASSITFTNTGNSKRPYAPAVVEAVRNGSNDILLRWSPRVRQNGGLTNGVETVLDQPYERYEIDVMNGATVVRTSPLTDLREWTYSAATHAADFGSVQDSVTFRLYQIGQIVGRGFARVLEA